MYAFKMLILSLAEAYSLIILIYILMSWIPMKRGLIADIDNVLAKVCDPYLDLFRRFIPPIGGVMDISPIFALLVLQFGAQLLVSIF